jgi:integrase
VVGSGRNGRSAHRLARGRLPFWFIAVRIPRATRLTFRRTYSSWSHGRGVPGKVVAQLRGHANVDTTLNVYKLVLDRSLREAVDRVDGELLTIVHKQ